MQEVGLEQVLERVAQDMSIQEALARWLDDMGLQTVAQCNVGSAM